MISLHRKILILLSIIGLSACGGGKFQGRSTSVEAAPPGNSDQSFDQIVEEDVAEGETTQLCDPQDAAGITSAEILTESLPLARGTKSVSYRISLRGCDGQVQDISDVPLLFDINSFVNPFDVPAPYRILADTPDREVLFNGTLQSVLGSDLFGNQGNFAHWKTENVAVEKAERSLILEVILDNFELRPRDDIPETEQGLLPTYLRIADARPVQTNVKFEP